MSERRQMRRRLREQLRVREALLLDLGALVYELHRQGRRAPELLQRKAAELTVVDEEVRELQAALDGRHAAERETTEVEADAAEELADDDALDEEDELRDDDLGDTTEFDAEQPADEGGFAEEDDDREGDERHEPSLAEREEPRA